MFICLQHLGDVQLVINFCKYLRGTAIGKQYLKATNVHVYTVHVVVTKIATNLQGRSVKFAKLSTGAQLGQILGGSQPFEGGLGAGGVLPQKNFDINFCDSMS